MSADLNDFGSKPSSGVLKNPSVGRAEEKQGEKDIITPNQWTFANNNILIPCTKTIERLQPGYYEVCTLNQTIGFKKKDIKTDELINFPDSLSAEILGEIDKFWKIYDNFVRLGFLHRRGYLFYGPPGSGKTCLVKQIVEQIVQQDGIVFDCRNPSHLSRALESFRGIEPTRQIVCTFEDLDAIIRDYGEESLLSLLDGENQVDRVLNIATTNYPESLDRRLVARPRRFDRVHKIDMPCAAHRKIYFEHKLNGELMGQINLDQWIKETENFGFAALTELIISVFCLGNDFDYSIKIMKKLTGQKASSNEYSTVSKTGFGVK